MDSLIVTEILWNFVCCDLSPDGSRHSSDQHPKDANSENSNYCPIFVREFLSSRRQTPEVWSFCVFTVFEFLSHTYREAPLASRGRKFRFFVFFVFCGLKLLRACLMAPALTGYVGGAQVVIVKPDIIAIISLINNHRRVIPSSSSLLCPDATSSETPPQICWRLVKSLPRVAPRRGPRDEVGRVVSANSSAPSPSQTHPPVISNYFLSIFLFCFVFFCLAMNKVNTLVVRETSEPNRDQ